ARQCAARGCPCAARSIRRWCPPSARGRYSSASGSADRRRSPAPRNATLGGPGGRQRGSDLLIARQRLIDLGKQVVAGHVVSAIDGGCKTLGIGAAVTLDDHAVEPEEDAAIGLARIHLLAQCEKCQVRLMAARRYCPICRAVPSAVLSAILPAKPSVTTTSTVPLPMSSPSTKP